MADAIDIDSERQREITAFEVRLETANHFEVLGLKPGASSEEVRNAFYELSRRYHPDRFFGKQLGPFKGKLDKIFRRLVEANQVVSDPEKLKAYLEANPVLRSMARQAAPAPQAKTADDQARDAERRLRLARHPYLAKHGKVQDSLAKARAAVEKGEFSQAFNHVNQALAIDPQHAESRALMADVRKKNESGRATTDYQRGLTALENGDPTGAVAAFRSASNHDASHHPSAAKAAELLERMGADPKESSIYAQRAVDAQPHNVDYRLMLVRLLHAGGQAKRAKKELDEAAKLDPNNPEVKKQTKRRWPF